ncbi:MAG TPA: LysR family transcriptional regulator [Nostocaceae cyanobacterium]|nr:LysR family transcriptional regulator [Nostocaceae cyanobacterium]
MELRHLRYFVTLAEELHFGRAAERLHIAQPPLSQQIRQLEAELGFQLFHRTKRTVELTAAGEVFLAESQQILMQLDQAIQKGRQISRGEIGQLVIGFVGSAAYNVLPEILRSFRTVVPGVTVKLHELTTDQQLQWLQEGRLDVGFVRPPVTEDTFSWEIIFEEPLMVALPVSHRLAERSHISLRELTGEPFILFPRSQAPGLYDQIISLCQQAEFSPKVTQEAIQMQTIVSLVAAEIGVTIVPASLQNLQRTGVVYKAVEESAACTACSAIAILWRKGNISPAIQKFLQIAKSSHFSCF